MLLEKILLEEIHKEEVLLNEVHMEGIQLKEIRRRFTWKFFGEDAAWTKRIIFKLKLAHLA